MKPAESLFYLAYASARAAGVTDDDVVDSIVLPSIAKNRTLGITGCMWFSPERFLQVLEGEEAAVRGLFDTIRVDDRHADVDVLASGPIAIRNFERFSMRALGIDAAGQGHSVVRGMMLRSVRGLGEIPDFEPLLREMAGDLSPGPLGPDSGPPTPA